MLERHRGKPMTVAAQRKSQVPLAARLKQLDPQLDALVPAARQLEVGMNEAIDALKAKWEVNDDRAARSRARPKQVL